MPRLVLKFDQEPLKTYNIPEPVITIGRLPENTISIVNMGVSRRHARIELDRDGKYVITDLNSLNGTFVNNEKVSKTALSPGDSIVIGKYTIVFEGAPAEDNVMRARPITRSDPETTDTDTFILDSQSKPLFETVTSVP